MNKYLLILFCSILFVSCNNDDDNDVNTSNRYGLIYTIDSGAEVYLPQGGNSASNTIYTLSVTSLGNLILVHELGNGFLFQSSSTDVNQTSSYNSNASVSEGTQLVIGGVLENPNPVDITFVCLVNEAVVGGLIRYGFTGTYTEYGVNHTITGEVSALIDRVD